MEWVASTLHITSEHGLSSITTIDEHTSAASSRLNWCPRRFKWTRPFCRKTKYGFCACAITFQTQSTWLLQQTGHYKPLDYTCFNIHKFHIVFKECSHILCLQLRTNRDYFLTRHEREVPFTVKVVLLHETKAESLDIIKTSHFKE